MSDATITLEDANGSSFAVDGELVTESGVAVFRQRVTLKQDGAWSLLRTLADDGDLVTETVLGIVTAIDVAAPTETATSVTINGRTLTIPAGDTWAERPPYGTLVDPVLSIAGASAYVVAGVVGA